MAKILSYSIIADEYERLMELERRYNALVKLIEANDPKFVTVSMISNAHGISRNDAFNRPWMLPNLGEDGSEHEGRKKRFWRYDEYLDWFAIPEIERIAMYREWKNSQ
jgi:hypothetical protein